MWLFSGRVLPTIMLLAMPLGYLAYQAYSCLLYACGYGSLLDFSDIIGIIGLGYSLYPIRYSSADYFKKRGFKNAIIEYEYVKKILYIFNLIWVLTFFMALLT